MSATLIRSFRHLECQNPSIISEAIGIPNGSEKMGKKWGVGTESYSYRRGLDYIHTHYIRLYYNYSKK